MRNLERCEIEEVSGGFGLAGLAIGAIGGFGSGLIAGGSAQQVFASTLLGALAGATGGLATVAGATRGAQLLWGTKSVGLTIAAAGITSSSSGSGSGTDTTKPEGDS